MVERPVKKSERLEKAAVGDTDSLSQPPEQGSKRPERRKGGKGKGKGARGDEPPKQAVNPALMRGPKPTKPKPVVEEVAPDAEVEAATDEMAPEDSEAVPAEVS